MKNDFSLVIKILTKVDQGSSLKAVLAREMNETPLPNKTKQRVFALTYEITRKRNFLDMAIQSLLPNTSIKALDPFLRNLARLYLYVKFYSPSYLPPLDDYINNSYHATHNLLHAIKGITPNDVFKNAKHEHERISLKYYMPHFIITELKKNFGELQAYNTLNAFLKASPTYFRINTLKISEQDALIHLTQEGISFSKVHSIPFLYQFDEKKSKKALPTTTLFKEGKIVIQDKASAYAALMLDPHPKDTILDMCASPGSKTSFLSALTNGNGKIIALELNHERSFLLSKRMKFLHAWNVQVINTDARNASTLFNYQFDKILLDPPCSAIGTFATRPDTKWRLKKNTIKQYARLQKELLEAAIPLLKNYGILVYSTCTLTSKENQENITWLLQQHPTLKLMPPPPPLLQGVSTTMNGKAQYLLPYKTQSEGFFIAILQKIE